MTIKSVVDTKLKELSLLKNSIEQHVIYLMSQFFNGKRQIGLMNYQKYIKSKVITSILQQK